MKAARKVYPENDRQAKKVGIYLRHRYGGAKLKEIGELFQLAESGVTRSSNRFEQALEHDETLQKMLLEIKDILKLSIA